MKHFSIALLALATSLSAAAQKSRISLNVYSLGIGMSENEDLNLPGEFKSQSISVLPAIGFHRIIKGNTGIGLELGYNRSRNETESTYQAASWFGLTRYEESKMSYDEFYACPSLFQVITTANKKYRFIPSLGLPVHVVPDQKTTQTQRSINQETGALVSGFHNESASVRTLRIGLVASTAAQIRVAGGFYAGLQLGAGIHYRREKTYGDAVNITNPGLPGERRTVTPSTNNLTQGLSFGFLPAISLNYFF